MWKGTVPRGKVHRHCQAGAKTYVHNYEAHLGHYRAVSQISSIPVGARQLKLEPSQDPSDFRLPKARTEPRVR